MTYSKHFRAWLGFTGRYIRRLSMIDIIAIISIVILMLAIDNNGGL